MRIPDICHGRHGRRPCKFFWAGVNFYRFNAKNWQKLAKIGVFRCKFRCILAEIGEKLASFGVNFILQKFCLCKNKTISDGGITVNFSIIKVHTSSLSSPWIIRGLGIIEILQIIKFHIFLFF